MNTPEVIFSIAEKAGVSKASLGTKKTLYQSFLAGAYVAIGGAFSLIVGYGFPELTAGNPGVQRILSGAVFPLGLILVVFLGAELFTGNCAILIPGLMNRKIRPGALMRNWGLVYLGNFVGALLIAYFLMHMAGISGAEPWHTDIQNVAVAKTTIPWWEVFLRGIGANWLVCLAIWCGYASTSAIGKIVGLWFPVCCFVALGFEHSVANMFFIPLGMMEGAPVGIISFLWSNLIPSTLGNIVGGGFFVGVLYGKIHIGS